MATKLKGLKISKVDFVDEGANQMADINLYKRKEPEEEEKPQESLFKRFLGWLRGEGMDDAQIGEEIAKAVSFNEQLLIRSSEQIENEMYSVTMALRSSLYSILVDTEMDAAAKQTAMNESVSQFTTAMGEYVAKWCAGQTAIMKSADEDPVEKMKADHEYIGELLKKLKPAVNGDNPDDDDADDVDDPDDDPDDNDDDDDVDAPKNGKKKKGVSKDMKVDKSKMSPEMQAAYDEMIAKGVLVPGEEETEEVEKKAPETEEVEKKATVNPEIEELKKSMEAEIAELRKQREAAEDEALMAVAKKYEVLGRKPEELVKKFKALKSVSEDLYNDEITALDELAKSMEQSVFGEIGKSREGKSEDAITKARTLATELRKSNPSLTEAQALDQVLIENDELRKELDQ